MAMVGSMLSQRPLGHGQVIGKEINGEANSIKQEVASGQISKREGHNLLQADRGIAAQARLDTQGGQAFGNGEAKQLQQELNGLNNITSQA